LEQSAQVPAGLRVDIASAQTEERRIFLAERQEPPTQSLQGRWGMAFLLPITNLSGVASMVTLDDASIVPYYDYQVPWIQEDLESDKVELTGHFPGPQTAARLFEGKTSPVQKNPLDIVR
jgi:hypothetical protein